MLATVWESRVNVSVVVMTESLHGEANWSLFIQVKRKKENLDSSYSCDQGTDLRLSTILTM